MGAAHGIWGGIAGTGLALVFGALPAHAGAWPQEKGKTLLIASFTVAEARQAYGADGRAAPTNPFSKKEFQIYAEHGWRDTVTLVGKAAYSSEIAKSPIGRVGSNDLRFIEGGVRVALGEWRGTRIALETLGTLTTATYEGDTFSPEAGNVDFESAVYFGQTTTLLGRDAFTDQRVAYRLRTGGKPDEINAIATAGIHMSQDWTVLLQSSNFLSIGPENAPRGSASAYKAHLSTVIRMSPILSLEIGGYTTYAGMNTVKDSGIKLGFWYHF